MVDEKDVDNFLIFVRNERGVDLSSYRNTFVGRRLQSRFHATNAGSLADYLGVIKSDPKEWNRFLDALSINVSEFFRDIGVFETLRDECLPRVMMDKVERGVTVIRCWSCGCSCGEEAYSLAILFNEFLKEHGADFSIRITATDIDEDALRKAKRGIYDKKVSLANVSADLLRKYFVEVGSSYMVTDEIKRMVSFKRHDFLVETLLDKQDIVFFRNVRIYLSRAKAESVLFAICNSLVKKGYMVLGKVENVKASFSELFEAVSLKDKIFRKK